ncbi:hypothetical protein [Halosimplex halophilum]|uniref:hypothetical protein n=1 Tax=Halosimplex halophilum TaxID=2559572 RepID=UPI00107F0482|nr:hypothetical protein [Halosimplex halophilum]
MTVDTNSTDGTVPEYFTEDVLKSYTILASAQQMLQYRSFLARNANNTIKKIHQGGIDFQDSPNIQQERNIIRALHAEMVSETISILEGLAAVSMNPEDPPEERARNLLTYKTYQVGDFYDSIGQESDLSDFKDIMSYPSVSELDIDTNDEEYYRKIMDGNADAYRDFFDICSDTWDILKDCRNKITHGFFLLLHDEERLATRTGGERVFPKGCNDYLATVDWDKDSNDFDPSALLIGEQPREAYLTVARNAAMVQNDVIVGLMNSIRNQGDPVFPERLFGGDHRPNQKPSTEPSYELANIQAEIDQEFEESFIQRQEEFLESVEELVNKYGA